MRNDKIIVRGAREHNLKNVSVELPRDSLIVMTGLSGSGKSSLAFDTIYAEGQRRYVESLSSYARQFLGQMEKPDVDSIDGLSPAISIDQKTTSKNPRSTVGTVTEIHDYLRLLYARAGVPHCPVCGKEIRQQTVDQIVDQVLTLPERTRIQVMAPVVRSRKGEYAKLFEDMGKQGFVRMRVDGEIYEISDPPKLAKTEKAHAGSGGRPPHRASGHTAAPHGFAGNGHEAGGRAGDRQRGRRGGHALFPELRLPGLQHLHRGTDAAHVLLQQPLRRLSHLLRPRRAA